MSLIDGRHRAAGPNRRLGRSDRASAYPALVSLVASAFRVAPAELCAPTRGRAEAAFARQVAMYLAHVTLGLTLAEVGRQFGRDRTTAAHACALVEDRRDDPRTDRALACLEAALQRWGAAFLEAC